MDSTDDAVTDRDRLLFGAGFAFGVTFTLLVLGVVGAGLGGGAGPFGSVVLVVAISVILTGLIGSATYLLAFPENRVAVPASLALGPDDAEEE